MHVAKIAEGNYEIGKGNCDEVESAENYSYEWWREICLNELLRRNRNNYGFPVES